VSAARTPDQGPRAALVTGAAAGLGRATAILLGSTGLSVDCLDRDGAGAEQTALAVRDAGGNAWASVCEVTDEAAVADAVARSTEREGRLDVLVNAAGVARNGHTDELTLQEWQAVLAVNLTGTFLVTRAALPALVASAGCIVNVASVAGLRGWPYMAAYAASKGGVVAFSRSLAVEYGRRGVRVNCVCPGAIDTALAAGLVPVPDADPALLGRAPALTDPPRAQPDEVAHAIGYLCSPQARFVTGAVHVIDGGVLA
jgi:NAD(P)-dependent dehydrogenase (short-subunit alcohol dehydrogenase family)